MGIRVGILGPLEVRDPGGQLVPVGGARLRSLLIRLAISESHPVPVDTIAADLWPDDGPADAGNAIQALVSRLRAAAGKDIIEYGPAGYRLSVPPGEIDAVAFERLVADARARLAGGDCAAAADLLGQALRMWRGPALADVADAPFATATISRLSELRLAASEDRIEADLALGRGAEIVPQVEELATAHPLRERLRGQQMRALYQAGRQADALAAFDDTREALASELGIDPSPGLAAVHLAVLRGELPAPASPAFTPGQGTPPPSAQLAGHRGGNLPAQFTSFVGRDEELGMARRLLADSRLVTLTGPGGAGKTRLSIEVGSRADAPDGVWFVPLSPVRDAIDVPQAVLTAVDGRETAWPADPVEAARLAAMDPLDRLTDMLAARNLVLVLDNCEHVIDAVAWLAGRVLASAPRVRILATSREPLGLTGETLCPVPSLPLPDPDADAEAAARNPAVRLFADRAAAVRPGFTIDADTAGPVVRICRALDGIPLAIELAAARVRALTPEQVADRLDDRFALLSTGTRGRMPRHQTLRAIVDWSWDLLDDTERAVLRRLAVFDGGATPDSAERVCGLDGERGAIVDVIAALVDKSLVTATGEHQVRYRLLETVRAYAAERLAEAGEADRFADAHAAYFLALAERAEPELRSRDQIVWLDRLSAEHDNFSAALRHVVASGDAAAALRFGAALIWFWITRDYDAEAGEWATAVLRLAGDAPPSPDLADAYAICKIGSLIGAAAANAFSDPERVLDALREFTAHTTPRNPLLTLALPMLALLFGDREQAEAGLAHAAASPDPWVQAMRPVMIGHMALNDGDIDSAEQAFTEARTLLGDVGDRFGLIATLRGLSDVALARGRPDEAAAYLEEARDHAGEGIGGNMGETMRIALARARAEAGDLEQARADAEAGLRFAEKIGEMDDVVWGYVVMSDLARRDGDLARARGLLERAVETAEAKTNRPDIAGATAATFGRLGCLAEQEGDLQAAAQWHQRALDVLTAPRVAFVPGNPSLAVVVEGVAALSAARGEHARAAELLGLARTLQGFDNDRSLDVRRTRAAVEAALSPAQVQAAYDRGRRLVRADALALRPAD